MPLLLGSEKEVCTYLKWFLSAVGFYRGVSGPKLVVVKDILVVLM